MMYLKTNCKMEAEIADNDRLLMPHIRIVKGSQVTPMGADLRPTACARALCQRRLLSTIVFFLTAQATSSASCVAGGIGRRPGGVEDTGAG
jgi:hypothetical protein